MDEQWSAWIGRQHHASDTLDTARANALRAALGEPPLTDAGDALPLLYHWLHFWTVAPPAALGVDGHPAKGGWLPPIHLPRRMWAGGRLEFHQPLIIGDRVTRLSTIRAIETKQGKSGALVFVTIEHQLSGPHGLAITEEQDIVYRAATTGPAAMTLPPDEAPPPPQWSATIAADPVLLFRYSALTMNGHRIHYDRRYAMEEEAYPALVVQGPLQATLLAGLAASHLPSPISRFEFRGQSPAFDGIALHICGEASEGGATLWAQQAGAKTMVATATCG